MARLKGMTSCVIPIKKPTAQKCNVSEKKWKNNFKKNQILTFLPFSTRKPNRIMSMSSQKMLSTSRRITLLNFRSKKNHHHLKEMAEKKSEKKILQINLLKTHQIISDRCKNYSKRKIKHFKDISSKKKCEKKINFFHLKMNHPMAKN